MSSRRLEAGSHILDFRVTPLLMGVINVTPDSFSDGGKHLDRDQAVRHGIQLVEDGADILDIGGESSRPGAEPVDLQTELDRVVPVVEALRRRVPVPLSIDTTKSEVAARALDAGAHIVNDISGLRDDPGMLPLLAASRCGIILMHMQGRPKTMQKEPHYLNVIGEIRGWFSERLGRLQEAGIDLHRVALDPGIGFGKRFEDNLRIMQELDSLRVLERPLLIGASRKRFLGSLLEEPEPTSRLEGDLAVASHCFHQGVELLRVHDVRATRRLLQVLQALDSSHEIDAKA